MELIVIQAHFGDCLLLKYNRPEAKYILIDGGPDTVYNEHLKNELKKVVGKKGKLEAVIISHVDNDHIVGVLDFFVDLKAQRDNGEEPFMEIGQLWLNTFTETIDRDQQLSRRLESVLSVQGLRTVMSDTNIVLQGVSEGQQLTRVAGDLGIPVNPGTPGSFFSVENNTREIKFGPISFTVVGPTADNLDALRIEWGKWVKKNEDRIARGKFKLAANSDKSVPNISSIMLLAEAGGKTILLTGDCRSDHLLDGLEARDLLDDGGKYHVDVLKVQHHGSNRNATKTFFQDVTADTYVISADGANDNPDYDTLEWIIQSASSASRKIEIIVTNVTNATRQIKKDYKPSKYGYTITHIPKGKSSIKVRP